MKKLLNVPLAFVASSVVALFLLASCVVDERYDMSKDIDATIGVGKGLAFPVGSTEKVFLSALIDTESVDILETDNAGNYVLTSSGSFSSGNFRIEETGLNFDVEASREHYDFELITVENAPFMPDKFPYTIKNEIEESTDFSVHQDNLPKEIKRLRKIFFREPVSLDITVSISSDDVADDDMLKTINALSLNDGVLVEFPEFVVLDNSLNDPDVNVLEDGNLMLRGLVEYDPVEKAMLYEKTIVIESVDFSKTEQGYIEIVDGAIDIDEKIQLSGVVRSDDIFYLSADNLTHLYGISVESDFNLSDMDIAAVEGTFEPEIDAITESVDLDFGEEMDFLKNAYIDLADPRIYLTFNNTTGANIYADASIVGYDNESGELQNTRMDFSLIAEANAETRYMIDRNGEHLEGWLNRVLPNLNELLKTIPDRIDINVSAGIDNTRYSTLELGKDMALSADYEVSVPLAFDDLRLEYTYSIEEPFGAGGSEAGGGSVENDYSYDYGYGYDEDYGGDYGDEYDYATENGSDAMDYIREVRGISLSLNVVNTIPLGLAPSVTMYDKDGDLLDIANIAIEGEIAPGAGYVFGAEPVVSHLKFKITSKSENLDMIDRIDIKLVGTGRGVLNENEYIRLTDISLTVDDYIVLDLNELKN